MNNQTPPNDFEAEQAVLGSILTNQNSIDAVNSILKENGDQAFFRVHHQRIFNSMIEMHENRESIDEVTVGAHLNGLGLLNECGGYVYLGELPDCVPSAGNVAFYTKIIRDLWSKRRMVDICQKTIGQIMSTGSPRVADLIMDHTQRIESISSKFLGDAPDASIGDLAKEALEKINELSKSENTAGIPTGIRGIDLQLGGGLMTEDTIVLGAESSVGKTSLAGNIALNLALRNVGSLFISSETTKGSLTRDRFFPTMSGVELNRIRSGNLNLEENASLVFAVKKLQGLPLFICDHSEIKPLEIYQRVKKQKEENGIKFVFIDYIQNMSPDKIDPKKDIYLGDMMRVYKRINKELEVGVIVLSQLNDQGGAAYGKTIFNASDTFITIIRKEETPTEAKAKFGKNRNGKKGVVGLQFDETRIQFTDTQSDTDHMGRYQSEPDYNQ